MNRRYLLPGVVLLVLVAGITIAFLSQPERAEQSGTAAPPMEGGPLVRLAPRLRGLEDGPDGEISARSYVEAVMDGVLGAPRAPILEALRHPDWGARWAGLLAVPRYGPADDDLADALAVLLGGESVRVRRLAATACGFLGPAFPRVEPALERAAHDADEGVRAEALGSLARHTRRASQIWTLFAASLVDEHGPARAAAAKGLARIELQEHLAPRYQDEIRAKLVAACADPLPDVRMYAVMALGRVGARAAPDVPAMLALLDDKSTLVRGTASNALGEIGPAALPAIQAALATARGERAASLLWALKLIGPPALPTIRTLLEHEDATLRVQAALKLWELEQPADATVAALIKALAGQDRDALRLAARGLARMGTAGAVARPALLRLRDHEDEVVRGAVRSALDRIEPTPPPKDR